MLERIEVRTRTRVEFLDVTSRVRTCIAKSGVKDGLCVVFCPHTTAAVTINENADPDVTADMIRFTSKLVPQDPAFRHAEGNSDSHVKSSLFGPSLTLIVQDGKPILGTWQSVYFCEFDGPRGRDLYVKTVAG